MTEYDQTGNIADYCKRLQELNEAAVQLEEDEATLKDTKQKLVDVVNGMIAGLRPVLERVGSPIKISVGISAYTFYKPTDNEWDWTVHHWDFGISFDDPRSFTGFDYYKQATLKDYTRLVERLPKILKKLSKEAEAQIGADRVFCDQEREGYGVVLAALKKSWENLSASKKRINYFSGMDIGKISVGASGLIDTFLPFFQFNRQEGVLEHWGPKAD